MIKSKILITWVLCVLVSNCYSVSTAAIGGAIGASAFAANNNRMHSEEVQNGMQMQAQHQQVKNSGNISGVFICEASEGKAKGYYAKQYSFCKFWDSERGYYYLNISDVQAEFFPESETISVIFNGYEKKFEFYYGTKS